MLAVATAGPEGPPSKLDGEHGALAGHWLESLGLPNKRFPVSTLSAPF